MFEKSVHSPYLCNDVFSLVSYELVQVGIHTMYTCSAFHGRFTASGVYYGLTLNATSLAGNDYLDTFISSPTPTFHHSFNTNYSAIFLLAGVVEVPAYLSVILIYRYFGRKPSASLLLVAAATCVGLTAFIPKRNISCFNFNQFKAL